MNLAQQLGEQALRIDTLEEMVRTGGGDPDAGARLDEQLQRERAAQARDMAEIAERLAALQEQHREAREALRLARMRETEQKRQLEVKTQALLDADKLNSKLEARVADQQGTIDQLMTEKAAVVTPGVPPSLPAPRMRRSTGPTGAQAGSCAFEILKLLPEPPDSLGFGSIRSRLPQFTDSNVSVTLFYLTKTEQVIREGSKHHYIYSKKVAA